MTWVTCYDLVTDMESLLGGGFSLLLGGIEWLPWVVNAAEVRGL